MPAPHACTNRLQPARPARQLPNLNVLTNTPTLIVTVTDRTRRLQPRSPRQLAGGPKLRKWYGQGERPADGGGLRHGADAPGPGEELDANVPRDAVLVTDADTPMGEFVVLQLILARCGAACSRQQCSVSLAKVQWHQQNAAV